MAASADGGFLLVLAGNGSAYLYDATIDDFVTGRTVIPNPITGYYGPVAAGSNGQYYLTNDQLLNPALTPVGSSGGTGPVGGGGLPAPGGPAAAGRPVAAVAALGAQSFARYSMPVRASAATAPTDAGLLEIVDVGDTADHRDRAGSGRSAGGRRGNGAREHQRPHDGGGSGGHERFVLTASGLSIIPLGTGFGAGRARR